MAHINVQLLLRTLSALCTWGSLISPFTTFAALSLGYWVKHTGKSRMLGAVLIALSTLMAAAPILILAWYMIYPPPPSDPGLSALTPLFALGLIIGPISFLTALVLVATVAKIVASRARLWRT